MELWFMDSAVTKSVSPWVITVFFIPVTWNIRAQKLINPDMVKLKPNLFFDNAGLVCVFWKLYFRPLFSLITCKCLPLVPFCPHYRILFPLPQKPLLGPLNSCFIVIELPFIWILHGTFLKPDCPQRLQVLTLLCVYCLFLCVCVFV